MRQIFFPENLRFLRKLSDLSQMKLSNLVNIPQPSISFLEHGNISPNLYSLVELADFFQIQLDALVFTNLEEEFSMQTIHFPNLGKSLKALREIHHLSKEKIAEKLGISLWRYAAWESSIDEPPSDKIQIIADFYHETVENLISHADLYESKAEEIKNAKKRDYKAAVMRDYRAANPERSYKQGRKYYEAHRDQILKKQKLQRQKMKQLSLTI